MEDSSAHAPFTAVPFQAPQLCLRPDERPSPRLRGGLMGRHAAGHNRVCLSRVACWDLTRTATGESQRSIAEWALYVLGLLATIAVAVYVTRVSTRALRQFSQMEND